MEIFTTLGRRRVEFEPRESGRVGMYVCGPTVQALPHLGHGRYAVVFDVLYRYLRWLGYNVRYIRNITDIDDKIIASAAEEGVSIDEVTARSAAAFAEAHSRLGLLDPTVEPRATDHIPDMIDLVETLVAQGYAYQADGDVYFSVGSYERYGRLSGHDPDGLRTGARVEPGEHKNDPVDFALWKSAKPGEPSWESPWGPGRPGWHIECSAMARRYLGDGFDLHGGGQDLIFPHHENEIAQSEAATRNEFARYWVHSGMVNLGGEKMAKSTGHVVGLLDALETFHPLAVRLFYLRTHYRKPLEYSEEVLADAEGSLHRLWAFRRRTPGSVGGDADAAVLERFRAALDDDLDVAGSLGVLFEAVREGNRRIDEEQPAETMVAAYDEIVGVLGLAEPTESTDDLEDSLEALRMRFDAAAPTVEALLERRFAARTEHDWTTADEIRQALSEVGVVVEDTPDGARWHRA
jgi:cysteinyl-tRNA synthetase